MVAPFLFISRRSLKKPWWNHFSNTQNTKGKELILYILKWVEPPTHHNWLFVSFQWICSFQRQMNLYQFVRTPRDRVLGVCKYKYKAALRHFGYNQLGYPLTETMSCFWPKRFLLLSSLTSQTHTHYFDVGTRSSARISRDHRRTKRDRPQWS